MKKAVIILPTYNERDNITKLITHLQTDIFPTIKNYHMGILVADDSSPDGTANVVKELMKKWKNVELSSGKKNGLGAAYVRGMDYAIEHMGADVVLEMDSDGQHNPKKIPEFLDKMDEGYDFINGTRYSDGGSIPQNWPLIRKTYSILANIFIRTVLGRFSIHDWTGGFRAIKKEVFLKQKHELTNFKGYTFQVAFLYKALRDGYKVAEVPFNFEDRTLGDSKIAAMEYITDVMKFVIYTRIMELKRFIKFLFVGGTGFVTQIAVQEVSIHSGFALLLVPFLSGFFSLFEKSHDPIILADSIGGGLGAEAAILSNFMFNNFWTFKDTKQIKEQGSFAKRLVKFNLASMLSILIQASAVGITETLVGRHFPLPFINMMVPTRIFILFPTIILLVIPINYIIYNRIIWKTQYLKHAKTH